MRALNSDNVQMTTDQVRTRLWRNGILEAENFPFDQISGFICQRTAWYERIYANRLLNVSPLWPTSSASTRTRSKTPVRSTNAPKRPDMPPICS
jgi:hypothetical protein